MLDFFVPGAAVAAGSKRAFPVRGRDGRDHVTVTDASGPKGREWRAAIRLAAADELRRNGGALERGAVRLALWFLVRRPRGHTGKRGLLPSAPTHPTTRPDVLKLARAVEDALTGVLWVDDAQVVDEELHKLYADGDAPIGVRVRVTPLDNRASEGVTA